MSDARSLAALRRLALDTYLIQAYDDIDAKMPMRAITIINSTKLKPLTVFLCIASPEKFTF